MLEGNEKNNQGLDNLFSSNSDFLTLLAKKEEEKPKPVEESSKKLTELKDEKQEKTSQHESDHEFDKLKKEFGKEISQVLPSPKKFSIEKEEEEEKSTFFSGKKNNFSDILSTPFQPTQTSFQKLNIKEEEEKKIETQTFYEEKKVKEPKKTFEPLDDFSSLINQKKSKEMYNEEKRYVDYTQDSRNSYGKQEIFYTSQNYQEQYKNFNQGRESPYKYQEPKEDYQEDYERTQHYQQGQYRSYTPEKEYPYKQRDDYREPPRREEYKKPNEIQREDYREPPRKEDYREDYRRDDYREPPRREEYREPPRREEYIKSNEKPRETYPKREEYIQRKSEEYRNETKREEYVQRKSEEKQINIESLKKFPGPIKKKEDVIQFIQEKIQTNISMNERQLWSLLYIFLNYKTEEEIIAAIRKLISKEINESNEKGNSGFKSKNRPKGEIEKDIIFMQKLLMSGNIEEGCNYAMENGLWAHALLLSSMVDKKTYQKVVLKFATSAFYDGSPMQTLYLMFAEKGELLFQSSEEMNIRENWKDNILIVLSNRTQSSGSILEKLGVKLWNEYSDIYASHFTFLVADYFTKFDMSQKIQLIGGESNNSLSNNLIDSIQRTEIFEYYKSMQNPNFIIPKFQEYKFIYARILFQNGLLQKSYEYVKSIKERVTKYPQIFNSKFTDELNNFEKSLLATGKVTEPTTGSWFIDSFTRLLHGEEKDQPKQEFQVKQTKPIEEKKEEKVMDTSPSSGSWFSWLGFGNKKEINFGKPNSFQYSNGVWKRSNGKNHDNNQKQKSEPLPEIDPQGPPLSYQQKQINQAYVGGYVDLFNSGTKKEPEKKYEEFEDYKPKSQTKSSFFKPQGFVQNNERDEEISNEKRTQDESPWMDKGNQFPPKKQVSQFESFEENKKYQETMKKVPSRDSNWMEKSNIQYQQKSPSRELEDTLNDKGNQYPPKKIQEPKLDDYEDRGPPIGSSWMETKKSNGPPTESSWLETKKIPIEKSDNWESSGRTNGSQEYKKGPPTESSWLEKETKKPNGPPLESSWMDQNGPLLPKWEMK